MGQDGHSWAKLGKVWHSKLICARFINARYSGLVHNWRGLECWAIFCVFRMEGFQGWFTIGKVGSGLKIFFLFLYARFWWVGEFSLWLVQVETFMCLFRFQGFQGWSTIGVVGLGLAMFLFFLYASFSRLVHNRRGGVKSCEKILVKKGTKRL